jgi:hypothetical protein
MQQKYEKFGRKISNMGIFYFETQNTSKDFSFSFSQNFSLNFFLGEFFDISKKNNNLCRNYQRCYNNGEVLDYLKIILFKPLKVKEYKLLAH